MRRALHERAELIESRARALLDQALVAGEAWTRALGQPPRAESAAAAWRRQACTVAAYRDRYGIVGASALGPDTRDERAEAGRRPRPRRTRYRSTAVRPARRTCRARYCQENGGPGTGLTVRMAFADGESCIASAKRRSQSWSPEP